MHRTFVRCLLGLLVFFSVVEAAAGAATSSAPPGAPGVRLGDSVRPLSYDAQLTLVPQDEHFAGHIRIEIELAQATTLFWMNATHLDIRHAQLLYGTHSVTARVTAAGRDLIGLHFAQTVPAGRASLIIDYEGSFERNDADGIFKVRDGDNWYLYTQFEPIAARRAFPCFDEPGWKTSWSLELTVPNADTVVANTPIATQESVSVGQKRVRFMPTAPLPSYLIAFAVGPFDLVDGGGVGRNAVPLHFVVPRGHAGELRYALAVTPRLLESIEEYVGVAFPFEKLDIAAVPLPPSFGAMENAGLITIAADEMLATGDAENAQFREGYASTVAHEIAHHWFGDLVTPQWWDDLWLSESFADWQSELALRHLDSGWQTQLSEDDERQQAINADRLLTTRAMRAPVTTRDEINSAFDAINYSKGASILHMFEGWMGADAFRNSVQRYLAAHAFGSVRSADLAQALSEEAGSAPMGADVTQAFEFLTSQAGVPALDITLDCGADGHGAPQLQFEQHRYLPLATQMTAANRPIVAPPAGHWVFPACFQYGEGADFGESCTVIREARQVMALPEGEKCPKWVVGNPRGASYFLPILSEPLMAALGHTPLLPDEAIAVLGDARILTESGDMPIDLSVGLAARFANSRQAPVTDAAVTLLRSVAPGVYAQSDDRESLAHFVQLRFGERAQRLGWVPHPNERAVDGLLRVDLLPLVTDLGADPGLRDGVEHTARAWLAGRTPLGDMLRPVLVTAAHYGTADLFDAYVSAAARANGSERTSLYTAIGSFRDPGLIERAITLAGNEHTDARDARVIFLALAVDSSSAAQALRYAESHFDETMKRLGDDGPLWLSGAMAHVCDANQRREFQRSFTDRVDRAGVGARDLANALEVSQLCIGSRSEQGARLHAFLADPSNRE